MREDPAAANIAIVDDDPALRQIVTKLLRSEGFRVTPLGSGRELIDALRISTFDLIVLDVMLPGQSGFDVCQAVRRTSRVPIMMLTSRGEETDRVVGLEIGADDYLTKPFGSRELLARVRALIRRASLVRDPTPAPNGTRYGFTGWTLDTMRRELTNPEGVVIDLTSGEYDVLLALVEAQQRVLSREQLLDLARNRSVVPGFDRSIDVQISRLRRKMGGEDAEIMIKTIRGAGYMFVPAVTRL